MRRTTIAMLLGLIALPASAQQAVPTEDTSIDNMPQSGDDAMQPQPEADDTPMVADRGGLTLRGGTPMNSLRSFQEVIGTEIYTPIGTAMGVQVRTPPQGD